MPTIYGIALRGDAPAADVPIALVSPSGDTAQEITTPDDGTFTFTVDAGVWTVRWTNLDGESDEGEIEVGEDDAEVEIVV